MKCPKCNSILIEVNWEDLKADQCPACHGYFLHTKEAKHRLAPLISSSQIKDSEKYIELNRKPGLCPQCLITMMQKRPLWTPKILIDQCTKCKGFWFESGELAEIKLKKIQKINTISPLVLLFFCFLIVITFWNLISMDVYMLKLSQFFKDHVERQDANYFAIGSGTILVLFILGLVVSKEFRFMVDYTRWWRVTLTTRAWFVLLFIPTFFYLFLIFISSVAFFLFLGLLSPAVENLLTNYFDWYFAFFLWIVLLNSEWYRKLLFRTLLKV